MTGEYADIFALKEEKHGVIPRSVQTIFSTINQNNMENENKYTVYCSFLQIYNEKLYDLLEVYPAFKHKDTQIKTPLAIREDKSAGIFVGRVMSVTNRKHD